MVTQATYISRRSESLKVLDLEIARLEYYAGDVSRTAAVQYRQAIHELQTTRDRAVKTLQELRVVGNDEPASEVSTREAEVAWKELYNAVLVAISATYGNPLWGRAREPGEFR